MVDFAKLSAQRKEQKGTDIPDATHKTEEEYAELDEIGLAPESSESIPTIELTSEQKDILIGMFDSWKAIKDRTSIKKWVSLSGFAGTGKTTLMSFLADLLYEEGEQIAFVSFTGKAASVLNGKLRATDSIRNGSTVSTMHSLMYVPQIDKSGRVIGWGKRATIEQTTIVVDEASMVYKELFTDLLEYKVPIIVLGDDGQLESLGEHISLVKDANFDLKEVHRQALESQIIQLSIKARETGIIERGKYSPEVMKSSYIFDPISEKVINNFAKSYAMNSDSIMLCGMHYTRVKLNTLVREANGIHTKLPIVGEKLICLRNNNKVGIFNGQHGKLTQILNESDLLTHVIIKMEDESTHECVVPNKIFGLTKYVDIETYIASTEFKDEVLELKLKWKTEAPLDIFDFGYAITGHKSQGSEWDNVLVFEEYNQYQSPQQRSKWLYTVVTRSKDKLVIIEDF